MALQFGMYKKISIVLPTDFYLSITVTDSFQNYCMTSQLCSLESLKRSALFSLQIFTCPSQWQTAFKITAWLHSSAVWNVQKDQHCSPYRFVPVHHFKITAWLHIFAVWNVRKDQLCSPYRFLPVHHSDRQLPKVLHDLTSLQFGMYKKISIVLPTDLYLSDTVTDGFQNYCMASWLCSLECTKRSTFLLLTDFPMSITMTVSK